MSADPDGTTKTLLERMVSAGMTEDRARAWIDAGVVKVGGEYVTSADQPVADGVAWLIHP